MKKVFLTAALFITLAAAPAAGAPENGSADSASQVVVVENVEQTIVLQEAPAADSQEGSEIHESSVAKKMTQAEKAQNAAVNDSWGGAITIIAMCIVVGALLILSLLFMAFGKVSEALLSRNKRESVKNKAISSEEHHEVDSGEVIAAISMALTEHFSGGHDYEDTILTIRRMKRAYSPWNSKIYNIRQEPPVNKNGFGL